MPTKTRVGTHALMTAIIFSSVEAYAGEKRNPSADASFPCAASLRATLGEGAFEENLALVRATALLHAEPDAPYPAALTKWREVPGYVTDHTDLETYPKLTVDCVDQRLYPTHPQQDRKAYHRYRSNPYDHFKLRGDEEPCLIKAKHGPKDKPSLCVRADTLYDTIISDVFEDACGHFYRGFKQVTFLGHDETIGTLFSAGRTVFPRPGSKIEGDVVPGHTYPVDADELIFVGPLLDGDEAAIQRGRLEAAKVSVYDKATRTYQMKP